MLNSEAMQKVRIICLKEDRYDVVSALHKLGIIDLRKSELQLSDDSAPEDASEISESLIRVDGAIKILPDTKKPVTKSGKLSKEEIRKELAKMQDIDKIYSLSSEAQALEEDGKLVDYAAKVAKYFDGIDIDLGRIWGNVLTVRALIFDNKEFSKFSNNVQKQMGKNSEVITNRADKNENLVFMAYKKGDEKIEEALKSVKGTELDLHAKYIDTTPEKILKRAEKFRADGAKRKAEIQKELLRLSEAHYQKLLIIRESLEIEMSRAEASSTFKRTEKTFVMEGWVPARLTDEFKETVQTASHNRFMFEEINTDELAPTLVNRPAFLKPFDFLMEFFSIPRSDELDPTWIFIISFPIFYGLMVSDVGYGIASFILSSLIIKKTDPEGLMYNVAKVWRLSAIPAIIVGILADQYFGFQLNSFFAPGITAFSWFTDITTIITLTVFFGITQVTLGFLFGYINESRHGHKKLAISKLTSIAALLFGTVAVAGVFFHVFGTDISLVSAAIAILSVLATAALSGTEAAEITNLITHPLSYARIMGFGIGSIIIAQLIDQAFTPHLGTGVVGIVVFIIYLAIFIVLHLLNMILSIFEGIVQGARLNFVEFFSKFYKGGGIKYRPMEYKRVYTDYTEE